MQIDFILYRPGVPGNVGAAARAIKTMGFNSLRLISPCDYTDKEALMLAHGSHDILKNARVYNSFDECVSDLDFLVATTAKNRSLKTDYYTVPEVKKIIDSKKSTLSRLGIVFGTEESGLPNEIIQQCDLASTIPLRQQYPSLNLAQAVMIFAYEFSIFDPSITLKEKTNDSSYIKLKERLTSLLSFLEISPEMPVYHRILERFSLLAAEDINLLHTISSRLEQKIKSGN